MRTLVAVKPSRLLALALAFLPACSSPETEEEPAPADEERPVVAPAVGAEETPAELVACSAAADCPAPEAPCLRAACALGACRVEPQPLGLVLDKGSGCYAKACDGEGNVESFYAPETVEHDGDPCTREECTPDGPIQYPCTGCVCEE